MRRFISTLLFLISFVPSTLALGQGVVRGTFSGMAGEPMTLIGFEGFQEVRLDSVHIDPKGDFVLTYEGYTGVALLKGKNDHRYLVILDNEDVELVGQHISEVQTIETVSSKENQLFVQYAQEYALRDQALSALDYLKELYRNAPLFSGRAKERQMIQDEILRLQQEDENFLNNLDVETYLYWYLPKRKLVSSVPVVAQYKPREIPHVLAEFRRVDYSDKRLRSSGLYREMIDSHFWLIENMGLPLDSVYREMERSIDALVAGLMNEEAHFNEVTKHLFELLESRSLFTASEYLALKILNQNTCSIESDFSKQLESYRTMKKGNIAPEIDFPGGIRRNGQADTKVKKMSEIPSTYKLVIFGSSWCPKCVEEMSQLPALYEKWKEKGLEIVFISLDTERDPFNNFTSIFPFPSYSDFKKWSGKAVQDYFVFATPTMFLLDKERRILLRPISVKQVDAWVNYGLKDRP